MVFPLRQKLTVILLLIYWPVVFVMAHIPIPKFVYRAQISDKCLHFLAYLLLVFLLWFAIRPGKKVNWRKATVWWIVLVLVWYGVIDELLQGYVGRACDVRDLLANLAGVFTGLIVFTFFTFWPALLAVTGINIFLLSSLTRVNLVELMPVTSRLFYLFAYGFFTIVWIRYIHLFLSLKAPQSKWLIWALALPLVFLLSVELFSWIAGRGSRPARVIVSAVGVGAVIVTIFMTALFRRWCAQKLSPGDFERFV